MTEPLIKVGDVLSFPPDDGLWGVLLIDENGFHIARITSEQMVTPERSTWRFVPREQIEGRVVADNKLQGQCSGA